MWAVPGYAHASFSPKVLMGFCSRGKKESTQRTNDVIGAFALCERDCGLFVTSFCVELVEMSSISSYQFESRRSMDVSSPRRPTVLPEDGGGGGANAGLAARLTDTRWCGCGCCQLMPTVPHKKMFHSAPAPTTSVKSS